MTERVYGVYTITCTANGRVYIGESSNVRPRLNWHRCLLRQGRHHALALQADWNEFGKPAFEFRTEMSGTGLRDKPTRLVVEQALIDQMTADGIAVYNLGMTRSDEFRQRLSEGLREYWAGVEITPEFRARTAEHGRMNRGRPFTDEHKAALAELARRVWALRTPEEVRERMAAMGRANLGVPKSAEHRRHISEGRKGIKFSDEHRQKLSESHAGNRSAARITEDVARQIKRRAAAGETVPSLAAEFASEGATYMIVRNIKIGKTWANLDVSA